MIRSNGGMVRKGEKATIIVFWKKSIDEDKDTKEKKRDHIFFSTHCPPYYKNGEADGGNEPTSSSTISA